MASTVDTTPATETPRCSARCARPRRRSEHRAAEALQAGEDIGGLQPRDLVTAFASAVWRARRVPHESAGLAAELAKVSVGRSGVEPARGDWRFKDPDLAREPGLSPRRAELPRGLARTGRHHRRRRPRLEDRRAGATARLDLDQRGGAHQHRRRQSRCAQARAGDRRKEPGARRAQLRPRRSPQRRHAVAGRHAALP